ncbi:MAG: hypothetical protein OHK0022_11890 [Roseiflexaceae bacterium]
MSASQPPQPDQRSQTGAQTRHRSSLPFLNRRSAIPIDPHAILLKGANQHNLKNVDVSIPRNKLVVLTGVSGSGKSSLAFDTIYAEGQHRYVETLSAYARQHIEQMEKPRVDAIVGLSPAIAIEQKTVSNNPRSTVGTITEITNYLRLLYSRIGVAHCVKCQTAIPQGQDACPGCGAPFQPLSAAHFSPNTAYGMCQACNGLGTVLEVDPALVVDQPHLSLMDGACRWYGDVRRKSKSKHALATLQGLSQFYNVDLETPWRDLPKHFQDAVLYGTGDDKIKVSFMRDSQEGDWLAESDRTIKGVIYHIKRLFHETKSEETRLFYATFMSKQPCSSCGGQKLCAEARAVLLGGKTITEVSALSINDMIDWLADLYEGLPEEMRAIGSEALTELGRRLQVLVDVGLHYLTLDRPAPTLSGGEGQRIRLASQIGLDLVGLLYVLDEPSIGLHPRDQSALIETLCHIRDMGNTVLVVEHDEATMLAADWLIDVGPGAGTLGGRIVAEGTPAEVMRNPRSITGQYLSGAKSIQAPIRARKRVAKGWLRVVGARLHNLRNVTAEIPLGLFTCVSGVSGSGKSSLIAETLYPALQSKFGENPGEVGPFERIEGTEQIKKVITITQDPIGRTPRSNPATYVGVFNAIRDLFAQTPEARRRGFDGGRFSFNVKGGRCEECQGSGKFKVDMHFLSDVWVTCKECHGTRFNAETLEVRYRGKTITEVLDLDVREALELFADQPKIAQVLQTMHDVGLDYIKLGQSATTLSGGEAQRIKLATELSRPSAGKTLYILDEPTTGLHFHDVQRLLDILHRLVDKGNTVLVIEHNLDVIKTADWVIDMGPDGGVGGGQIVAAGRPEQIAQNEASVTGQFLRPLLNLV